MRRVRVDRLREEVVLAGDLFDLAGRPVLRRGMRLRPEHADRLQRLAVGELVVEDPLTPDLVIEPILPGPVLARVLPGLRELYGRAAAGDAPSRLGSAQLGPLVEGVMEAVEGAAGRRFEGIGLAGADYLVAHALHVAVLAPMLALRLGIRPVARVADLALAGLVQDLGMLRLPRAARYRPGPLTDEEWAVVRQHPQASADALDLSVSSHAVVAVLQHHERLDGSGYPQGLRGEQVHELAAILAVADVYLALQEDRPYRRRFMPHEALEYLLSEAGKRFAIPAVRALTQVVNPYPVGVRVRLSSGRVGVVLGHSGVAARPVVRVVEDGRVEDVDLAAPGHQTEFITELLYD